MEPYDDPNTGHNQLALDLSAKVPPEAYDGVAQAAANAERGWLDAARHEIECMARSGIHFTADDLRRKIGEPDHPARWGGVFTAASRAGRIEVVHARPSATPSRHGSLVRVWRGVARGHTGDGFSGAGSPGAGGPPGPVTTGQSVR